MLDIVTDKHEWEAGVEKEKEWYDRIKVSV